MVVYKITIGDRSYVGSSKNFEQRKKEHLRHLRDNKHHSPFLQRQYNKYGNPEFEVLEQASSIEEMHQLEEKWILAIGVLNSVKSALGGDRVSQLTGKAKEEWKKNLRARKGSGNCNVFLHLTEEERNNRLQIWSEVKKGSGNGRYKNNQQVLQIDKVTQEVVKVWNDVAEVGRSGYMYTNVLACLREKEGHKTCKGYLWKWKNQN